MPVVSVIIPLYNKANWIGRAIKSVLGQGFADLELLVVDDGSSDDGPAVVREYQRIDPRVTMIHQENSGPGLARNTGLAAAKAPLVAFLDADDEWFPYFLTRAVASLNRYPDCDIFASTFVIGPHKSNRWSLLRSCGFTPGPWSLSRDISDEQLSYALAIFHSVSCCYRKSAIDRFGGFYSRPGCRLGEDVYMWLQLMLNCRIYICEEPLAWYHCEDSELGFSARLNKLPLEPVFTDGQAIRSNCPPQLLDVLERWLAIHASRAIHRAIETGQWDHARFLLEKFPRIRDRRRQYLKIIMKMNVPGLAPALRYVRSLRKETEVAAR